VGANSESSGATGINGNQADSSAMFAGAAYVFTRSGTTWSQQAYIKASNTKANASFGDSVALSGDTLAVGASLETSNATGIGGNQADTSMMGAGAIYVFTRTGTTWSQQAYIKASNTRANALFGYSAALFGDTLAVGAYQESSGATGLNGNQADTSATNAGATYIFTRAANGWSQQAYVKASNTTADARFAYSVALSADTLAVGAYNDPSGATGIGGNQADTSAPSAGAAYVFTRSGSTWSQQAYVKASNARANSYFGVSLAVVGDTLAVGAFGDSSNAMGVNGNQADTSAANAGAAYLFTRTGSVWSQLAYAKPSNTQAGSSFSHLALSGDTLAVAATGDPSNATGVNGNSADTSLSKAGAVFVLR